MRFILNADFQMKRQYNLRAFTLQRIRIFIRIPFYVEVWKNRYNPQ